MARRSAGLRENRVNGNDGLTAVGNHPFRRHRTDGRGEGERGRRQTDVVQATEMTGTAIPMRRLGPVVLVLLGAIPRIGR